MKIIHLVSAIAFCSALMGCQIQVSGLGDVTPTDEAGVDNATNGSDTNSGNGGSTVDTSETVINLYWSAPLTRLNGDSIFQSEIGGYEIRYKQMQDNKYSSIVITDNSVEQYNFDSLDNPEDYTFEVAAFDTNGVYSNFVIAN